MNKTLTQMVATVIAPTAFLAGAWVQATPLAPPPGAPPATISTAGATITVDKAGALIRAGLLERRVEQSPSGIRSTALRIAGANLLDGSISEFALTFSFASPDEKPRGITDESIVGVRQENATVNKTDALVVQQDLHAQTYQTVRWLNPLRVEGSNCAKFFEPAPALLRNAANGRSVLNLRLLGRKDGPLAGVIVDVFYQVDAGFPAIRKWIQITNDGPHWLKIEDFTLDETALAKSFRKRSELTPSERGAVASVVAFSNEYQSRGIVFGSEIPSALRGMSPDGAMGYRKEHFEWVIGPAEHFDSEAIFHFGFDGESRRTISSVSTGLDRAVEGPYLAYLENVIGVAARPQDAPVPLWCSWSNFGPKVSDAIVREMADAAAAAGFVGFLIDGGWSQSAGYENWDCGTAEPSIVKFPDFEATCAHIRNKGLKLGLWMSCFRTPETKDLQALPRTFSLPLVRRGEGGLGMSYAGPWRKYLANDLVALADRYGASYFKQDLTNIKYGDINAANESRTLKESLLRGLRGLLESQRLVRSRAPHIYLELTHEVYWGTPGTPCDLAAIKSVDAFHIPPNDYSGSGPQKNRVAEFDGTKVKPEALRQELLRGCLNARQRFYEHRGLPLYCVEYYAAATVNWQGSLPPEVQDRQVCSWLMGMPSVYSGDLASLTPENIAHYRRRFDLVKRLERDYGIYRHFQFSGVPAPTDEDWHWWGKLTAEGSGAVVVLRGNGGSDERTVNIPWVPEGGVYQVIARLSGRPLGTFTGRQLQEGALHLQLPPLGQEILEVKRNP
ncbi:MAG: hypothetical protein ABI600_16045 [Luteolibacter sp.]